MGSGEGYHVTNLLSVCGATCVRVSPVRAKVLTNEDAEGYDGDWPGIIKGRGLAVLGMRVTCETFHSLGEELCDNAAPMMGQRGAASSGTNSW